MASVLPPWQKEVVLVMLVCLSVSLFIDNIIQNIMNGFEINFMVGSWVEQ